MQSSYRLFEYKYWKIKVHIFIYVNIWIEDSLQINQKTNSLILRVDFNDKEDFYELDI